MSTSSERKDEENKAMMPAKLYENFFDSFQRQMESMMKRPWSFPTNWELPSFFEARDMRMALYELVDKGDKFELQVEVPGLEREKIDVKATKHSVEISGKHSEKSEEKGKRYVYSERMYRSFYRHVMLPEEIVPSRVGAKLENGILKVELPKRTPTKGESDATKVDVK
jgi:HSP20 family protein